MLALYGTVMFPPTSKSPWFRADRSAHPDDVKLSAEELDDAES